MFNMNKFKQKTKEWLKHNPDSSKEEFLSYCQGLIPTENSDQHSWLLDQVALWFDSVTFNREKLRRSKSRNLAS